MEFHVAGVVRDRSLISFNQVDQQKSSLARTRRSPPQPAVARRSPPQPAAARRSPPQPAAARVAIGAKPNRFFCKGLRVVIIPTQTTRPYSASCDAF